MESHFHPLKSVISTLLSSSSTSWAIDIILAIFCGVLLFLLLLPCLPGNPPWPPPQTNMNTRKAQGETGRRSWKRNKSHTVKAVRTCQEDLQEARRLLELLQTHLGKASDRGGFGQRKCRDEARCAKAHRQRCAGTAEGAASQVSPSPATTPLAQLPLHRTSTLSARPSEDTSQWTTVLRSSDDSYSVASSVPTILHWDCPSRPTSALHWWWAATPAVSFPTWKQCKSLQEHTAHLPSKVTFRGGLMNSVEAWSPLSHQQPTSVPSLPGANQSSGPGLKSLYIPRPWGTKSSEPSPLHTQSVVPTAWVSANPSPHQSPSVLVKMPNTCPFQVSSPLSQPQPLLHPKPQPQPLIPARPQSQAPPPTPVLTQAQLQSSCPSPPPPSTAHIRAKGISCPLHQIETKSLMACETDNPECMLQEPPKDERAVRPEPQRSQEAFHVLSLNLPQDSKALEAHVSDSILPGDVPSRAVIQKQLEQHLRKRLTQYHHSLSIRTQQFVELTGPPGACKAKDQHRPSRPSEFEAHVSDSILPGDVPSRAVIQKQLEQHLRKRLTQYHHSLSIRTQQSVELTGPPGACKAKDQHRPSRPSGFEAHVSDSILPGDVPSRAVIQKQLEQHLQKRLTQYHHSLPSGTPQSVELTGRPGACKAKDQHRPSRPSGFEAPKLDSILPGDVPSRAVIQKQLEQHLQKRLTQYHHSLSIRTQQSVELTGRPGACKAKDQHRPSRPSGFRAEVTKDIKKMGSRQQKGCHVRSAGNFQLGKDLHRDLGQGPADTASQGSASFPVKVMQTDPRGLGHSLGQVPTGNVSRDSENFPVKVVQMGSEKMFNRDPMSYSGSDKGNHIVGKQDKEQLKSTLRAHLGRKLEKIVRGQIPICVRRSWLMASHSLPKSHTHVVNGHPGSLKRQAQRTTTTQALPFPTPEVRQALEAHVIRLRVRHKWDPSVQVGEPTTHNLRETQSFPLCRGGFPVSAWDPSRAEPAMSWRDSPQAGRSDTERPKLSAPTLESPLPAATPAGEEVQETLRQRPPRDEPGPSEAMQSGQEGRQPFQPLTPNDGGRTSDNRADLGPQRGSLEPRQSVTRNRPREELSCGRRGPSPRITKLVMSYEDQSSRTKESREVEVAKGSSAPQLKAGDLLTSGVLPKAQNTNMDLGASRSPGRSPVEDSRKTCITAQALSEAKLNMELETSNWPQGFPKDVLLASDILASSQAFQRPSKLVSNRDLKVLNALSDLMVARVSSLGQQNPKSPKLHDTWESQAKTSAPVQERGGLRRPRLRESEEGLAFPASGLQQPAQEKRSVEFLGMKARQLSTGKGHTPPECQFQKKMKEYVVNVGPDKQDRGQDEPLHEATSPSASAQSWAPQNKAVFMDRGGPEVKTLITSVSQILYEKLKLHRSSSPSKHHQESQAPLGGHPSYCKAPSYSEHKVSMSDRVCHHQATPQDLGSRNKWCHEGHPYPSTMVGVKHDDGAFPFRGPVSPVSPCRYASRMWAGPGCPHHCLPKSVCLIQPDNSYPVFTRGKILSTQT